MQLRHVLQYATAINPAIRSKSCRRQFHQFLQCPTNPAICSRNKSCKMQRMQDCNCNESCDMQNAIATGSPPLNKPQEMQLQ